MHVIQHLRIEILAEDQPSARARQEDISRWIRTDAFWQSVSDRLDAVVPAGMVLEIPKIEVEVGVSGEVVFLDTLLEEFTMAVEEHLRDQETIVTDAAHLRKAVMYFLAHGYLPAGISHADAPRVVAFLQAPDENFDTAFSETFLREIPGKPQMITRMAQYAGMPAMRRFLLATLLETTAIDIPLRWIREFFEGPVKLLKTGHERSVKLESAVWEYLFQNPAKEAFERESTVAEMLANVARKFEDIESQHFENAGQPAVDNAGIFYVDNAGVVVLAPFFPQLFKALGWIEQRAWKTDAEMSLAVRLIGYICTGVDNDHEYDWILAKILCGVPPETVIDCQSPLPREAMEVSVQMMEAVVDQWKVLKSTSPAGLRELFIRRDGKLTRDDEGTGWRLQVEKKSQDALLERLPWGIAVIRMPWMDDMLLVEW